MDLILCNVCILWAFRNLGFTTKMFILGLVLSCDGQINFNKKLTNFKNLTKFYILKISQHLQLLDIYFCMFKCKSFNTSQV